MKMALQLTMIRIDFLPPKTLQTLHFRKQMIVQNEQRKLLIFHPQFQAALSVIQTVNR